MTAPDRHAEVIGAGIVGLGVAGLLAQAGWSVRVHERAEEIREVGAAIGIRGGGLAVLKKLGVLDLLGDQTVVLKREERRDARGGILVARDRDAATTSHNPFRQDLINALLTAAGAAGAEVVTSSQVVQADATGTVRTADGEEYKADLVVAADGFRSRTRVSAGLEREAKLLHSGVTRVLIEREGEPFISQEYWSGRLRIGIAPASETVTYAFLSCPETDARASAVPIDADYWARAFPGLPRGFFDRIEAAGGVRHLYPVVRCRGWSAGRLALVGDAAHALPSTLGLGATMGLVNADFLVEAVDAPDIEAALAEWDARRRPIAERVQRIAELYDTITVRCPPGLGFVRDLLVRLLAVPAVRRRVFGTGAYRAPAAEPA
jgi:2-polyprenyl-6-methoxyphenol hydroxylase-like FAD-dependent oxidoreductase